MKNYLFGNWKNYLTIEQSKNLAQKISEFEYDFDKIEIAIFPSIVSMASIKKLSNNNILIGSQNVDAELEGPYTGALTINSLKELGIKYCLIGHSERRVYYNETNLMTNKKIKLLIENDITPVLCIGENKNQRESDESELAIKQQFVEGLAGVDPAKVILAYEPVWAIKGFGATESASLEQVEKMHKYIRGLCDNQVTPILYGGSVNSDISKDFISSENINGFLVGSASTKYEDFIKICYSI